jgi:hypothetical protein
VTVAPAVTTEFTLPAPSFPFGRATSYPPTVQVYLERFVPLTGARIPFLWVSGTGIAAFERHLRGSELVADVDARLHTEERALYAVEWDPGGETFLDGLGEAGGTIMDAHGNDPWSFTVRFPDHDALSHFSRFCRTEDFPVDIERVCTAAEHPGIAPDGGITSRQRQALLLAVEGGYFAVPRETTLEEIADELGVSPQNTSELVRRGAGHLLRRAFVGLVDEPAIASVEAGPNTE